LIKIRDIKQRTVYECSDFLAYKIWQLALQQLSLRCRQGAEFYVQATCARSKAIPIKGYQSQHNATVTQEEHTRIVIMCDHLPILVLIREGTIARL